MKKFVLWGVYAIGLVSLMLMGFQCSSKEMTSAKLYIQRKEYENAAKQLETEVAKNPVNEEAWFLLGQVHSELKQYKEMKDAFVKTLEVSPKHKKEIDSYNLSTWSRLFNHGIDVVNKAKDSAGVIQAVESFTMAAYIEPDSLINQDMIGYCYYRAGDFDSAIPYLKEAFEKGKLLTSCTRLGNIYLLRADDHRRKFLEVNDAALQTKKNLENIHENMKAADVKFYIGQPSSTNKPTPVKGKGKKTEPQKEQWMFDQYNLVLTVDGDLISEVKYTKPYTPNIDSSEIKSAYKEYDKAIGVYRKGIEFFPEDQEISDNLMNSFIGAERNDEAFALLNARVKKYPDSKLDHYNLGVFFLRDNKFEDAVNQFSEVLRLDDKYSQAIYNLAATYVNWGVAVQDQLKKDGKEGDKSYQEKFRKAIPYLEKVREEKPNDVRILDLLGQVYANLGDAAKAKEAYDKADAVRSGKN
ncbi:MAG: tetratricopeptide repeat protein [Bacteroidetes bacterium]|nr:tetratricopeptide repeat protein [Bacteroidota bacterium]